MQPRDLNHALLAALSARAPRGLRDVDAHLEHDAGLFALDVRAALAGLAPRWPVVNLAGEQLASCVSVREMESFLAQLEAFAPFDDEVFRYELREQDVQLAPAELPGQMVLIGRERALLEELAQACQAKGSTPTLVFCDASGFTLADGERVSFERTVELAALLHRTDAGGEPAGVLFISGARNTDLAFTQALEADVVALLGLAKALEADMLARRLAVVCLSDAGAHTLGARGVARALAQEWRESPRSVSSLRTQGDFAARALLDAGFAEEALTQLVLSGNRVDRELLIKRELPPLEGAGTLTLDRDSVVLLVGGAVGIAAEMAVGLSARFGCAVAAIGRSPYSGTFPFPAVSDADLGAAVHAALEGEGGDVSPERLRSELAQVKRKRAVHRTAERLRLLGVRFAYHQADARDEAALTRAVRAVQEEFGRVDVVVHAAGVVEDATLPSKTFASFRRVLTTKALSALYLRRALATASPKLVVLLSSLVGHTGNAGQTDYCAANEVLDALAREWSRQVPYRVVATAWSVWDDVGLASRGLRELLSREGVRVIEPEHGVVRFVRELAETSGPSWVLFASPRSIAMASGALQRVEVQS
jgi:NAD(P)-dependent dehydrogenase (short-subunit alcohol dehydrogenase family)